MTRTPELWSLDYWRAKFDQEDAWVRHYTERGECECRAKAMARARCGEGRPAPLKIVATAGTKGDGE